METKRLALASRFLAIFLTFSFFLGATDVLPAQSTPGFEIAPWILEDASLRSVHFTDPDRGWAVGDFGVILHTKDGGTNWLRQESGVRCHLSDVTFSSSQSGYAVGGWFEPDTGLSRGVLLSTNDGGQSWNVVSGELPLLKRVWLLSDGGLLVFGGWSTAHLGRVLYSRDRGTNWTCLEGQHIADAQFVEVVGDNIFIVDTQGIVHRTDVNQQRPVAASVVGKPECVLAGYGNIIALSQTQPITTAPSQISIALSRDAARTWSTITKSDNPFRPHAGTISPDQHAWISGLCGERLLRVSPNGTCTEFETRAPLPLHDIHFFDNFRGWAVGAYGTILVTRDGGQSWRAQRLTGLRVNDVQDKRAMMLGVANQANALPWSALAIQSLEYGQRVAMTIHLRENAEADASQDPLRSNVLERCRDAALRIGAGEVLFWSESDVEAVLQSYRPRVLVLGQDMSDHQQDLWIQAAIRNGVDRVFQVTADGRADVTLASTAVLPVAAAITGDLWSAANEIVAAHQPIGSELKLQRRFDQSFADNYRNGVADGLPNNGTVRIILDGRRRNLQVLQARSGERGLIDRLLSEAEQASNSELAQRLELLLKQTTKSNQMPMLRNVLTACQQQGDKPSLRLFLTGLRVAAEQYPESTLGQWARLRYEAISYSSEWQRLLDATVVEGSGSSEPTEPTISVPAYASPFERLDTDSNLTSNLLQPNSNKDLSGHKIVGVVQAASTESFSATLPKLKPHEPTMSWNLHPALLLWRQRFLESPTSAFDQLMLTRLEENASSKVWGKLVGAGAVEPHFASATYKWSATSPNQTSPNQTSASSSRPLLDGVLEEACWLDRAHTTKDSLTQPRSNIDGDTSLGSPVTTAEIGQLDVRFAYDAEFIYVAVQGVFAEGDSESPMRRRNRDDALESQPRVLLSIDTDRDLWTSYQLSVDRLGRTRDTCDGFTHWQPIWYVATKVVDGVRTVEAAIRREDLSSLPPVKGERWRVKAEFLDAGEVRVRSAMPHPEGWRDLIFD